MKRPIAREHPKKKLLSKKRGKNAKCGKKEMHIFYYWKKKTEVQNNWQVFRYQYSMCILWIFCKKKKFKNKNSFFFERSLNFITIRNDIMSVKWHFWFPEKKRKKRQNPSTFFSNCRIHDLFGWPKKKTKTKKKKFPKIADRKLSHQHFTQTTEKKEKRNCLN